MYSQITLNHHMRTKRDLKIKYAILQYALLYQLLIILYFLPDTPMLLELQLVGNI